jgi:hypothetical protein
MYTAKEMKEKAEDLMQYRLQSYLDTRIVPELEDALDWRDTYTLHYPDTDDFSFNINTLIKELEKLGYAVLQCEEKDDPSFNTATEKLEVTPRIFLKISWGDIVSDRE